MTNVRRTPRSLPPRGGRRTGTRSRIRIDEPSRWEYSPCSADVTGGTYESARRARIRLSTCALWHHERMSFTTRAPVPSDAAAIADLHVSTWREAYAHLLPEDFGFRFDGVDPGAPMITDARTVR